MFFRQYVECDKSEILLATQYKELYVRGWSQCTTVNTVPRSRSGWRDNGDKSPAKGEKCLLKYCFQTGFEVHLTTYPVWSLDNAAGAWSWPLAFIWYRGYEYVEICLHFQFVFITWCFINHGGISFLISITDVRYNSGNRLLYSFNFILPLGKQFLTYPSTTKLLLLSMYFTPFAIDTASLKTKKLVETLSKNSKYFYGLCLLLWIGYLIALKASPCTFLKCSSSRCHRLSKLFVFQPMKPH
jgi:hypothetical protein